MSSQLRFSFRPIFIICQSLSVLSRDAMLVRYMLWPCVWLSVSVTSRCSTKTAKHRITQTTPHDSPWILVFWRQRSCGNSTGVTPSGGAKCIRRYVLPVLWMGSYLHTMARHRSCEECVYSVIQCGDYTGPPGSARLGFCCERRVVLLWIGRGSWKY